MTRVTVCHRTSIERLFGAQALEQASNNLSHSRKILIKVGGARVLAKTLLEDPAQIIWH